MKRIFFYLVILILLSSASAGAIRDAVAAACTPTEEDALGPFYKPDAPLRSTVGKGYMVKGIVRSSKDCRPVPGAVIEFWLAGPNGEYDDAHRATVIADASGAYRFESNPPQRYYGRPPHIHLRITAKDFFPLVTQHYPLSGARNSLFDIVLVPAR